MIFSTALISINKTVLIQSEVSSEPTGYGASLNKMLRLYGYKADEALSGAIDGLNAHDAQEAITKIVTTLREAAGGHVSHVTLSSHVTRDLYDFVYADWAVNRINLVWELNAKIATGVLNDELESLDYHKEELKVIGHISAEDARDWCVKAISQPQTCSPGERNAVIEISKLLIGTGYAIQADMFKSALWRENIPLCAVALDYKVDAVEKICTTSSDILRLAAFFSDHDSDLSLAKAPRFKLSSMQRRLLLGLTDHCGNGEDMMRHREIWLRLGETLHPTDPKHARRWPIAAKLWTTLRNDPKSIERWNALLEKALNTQDSGLIEKLAQRPGSYARALAALLTRNTDQTGESFRNNIIAAFGRIVDLIPTATLLSLYKNFIVRTRGGRPEMAVYYTKGQDAAPIIAEDVRHNPNQGDAKHIIDLAHESLTRRFSQRTPLGKVWIDPELAKITVNRSKRSAMEGSNVPMNRGSIHNLSEHTKALRLFTYWENGNNRVDVDLSAMSLNEDFECIERISYMQLNGKAMAHSGDITDGRDGASEYIDINLKAISPLGKNTRYIAIFINAFSGNKFDTFPCFAGVCEKKSWPIAREFDAKSVALKFDINTQGLSCIPMIYDLLENRMIVINANTNVRTGSNIESNSDIITTIVRDAVESPMYKLNCFEIASLHAQARGTIVENAEDADTIFTSQTTSEDDFTAMASDLPEEEAVS